MGIMSFLRNRAGAILVGAIGLAIVAFLVGDIVSFGGSFGGNGTTVGEVAGQSIEVEEFRSRVEQNEANFKQQMGQSTLNAQMSSYVVENTWNQTVSEILLDKEVKRLGLTVGATELNEMVTGKNPDPQVVQAFGDPQTGQIDRNQLNAFLNNIDAQGENSPMGDQWGNFLISVKRNRLFQKYNNLVRNSIYVTSLEAREDYAQRNKLASFSFVNLEYASLADDKVKLTDDDYQEYYNENKKRFVNKEQSRSFEYVIFDASPSVADSTATREQINKLAAEFKTTTNDSLFVSVNADTKSPLTYMKRGQLEPELDSAVFSAAVGDVIGPVYSNGAFKVAKVTDIRMSPDSVKASHILLNPAMAGGLDKARAQADSILQLIKGGQSFAELAAKFGTDGTKDQGGGLGTFSRGSMVPEFEEAVFNGKPGDLKVVSSQFGVHVVRIDKHVGSSRVAKVGIVDRAVASSNQTQQAAYSKASAFLSGANNAKAFDELVEKDKLRKLVAEDVTPSQSMVSGLENPREIVRWAFEAEEGDISDKVFEMENTYVVAKLTEVNEEGTLPLEKVKKDIEPAVRNLVKARVLSEQLEKALSGSTSIAQVASKAKREVQSAQNVVFANPIVPGVAQENKVVGAVFGLQPKKLSKVIKGEQGVYVVEVQGFTNPAPLKNTFSQKQQISQMLDQRAQGQVLDVLKDKANVKDYRLLFF